MNTSLDPRLLNLVKSISMERHIPTSNYAKSRGLIVLDVVSHETPQQYLAEINLDNIEPFTLVVSQEGILTELRWDGSEKFIKTLNSLQPHIWSSATLYDKEAILARETLFFNFILEDNITNQSIIDFHSNTSEDLENGFVIERATGLTTFSVTQAVLENDHITLKHIDLLNQTKDEVDIGGNQLMKNL